MKGKILDFNFQESKGVVLSDDGQRYNFENTDWKGSELPKVNQVVDFEIVENSARNIYSVQIKNNIDFSKINNKMGFGISLLLILGYFIIPIQNTYRSTGWFSSELSSVNKIIDYDTGLLALFVTLICAYLFYSGGKKVFIKITTAITAFLIIYILHSKTYLFENLFSFDFRFGHFMLFALVISLVVIGFKKNENYKN
ncbi:hypothetical protein ACOTWR_03755 [Aliarcobacter butzleri]|uniref:hypothetical protein n=1 Tax=Aliarcobacter butzleri TaxID=28197 RepID=UPI00126058F3|nr:hypothetical protein [Aliarcobacter butzleri]MCT7562161.1 hypothetical protein [Aliarcobacter butzleri]